MRFRNASYTFSFKYSRFKVDTPRYLMWINICVGLDVFDKNFHKFPKSIRRIIYHIIRGESTSGMKYYMLKSFAGGLLSDEFQPIQYSTQGVNTGGMPDFREKCRYLIGFRDGTQSIYSQAVLVFKSTEKECGADIYGV